MEKRSYAAPASPGTVTEDVTPTSPSGGHETMDEADKQLEAMGYKPVFKREFSSWSIFSFAMSISGIYGSLMGTWVYGLQAGGAAAIMWSWIVGGAGAWALALSLAELASAYPSSGAMYFTLKFLAPEKQVPILCWMSGYISLIGTIAGSASTEFASSQMLLAAVSIMSDFSYVPTTGHVFAVMAALAVVHACINTLPTLWLNRITSGYVVFHMSVLVGACVCLLVRTKDKHSLHYAFTDFQPSNGWNPPGFAFLFGCLTPAWIMTSADSTARIAEEAKHPARTIPKAIFLASTSTYLLGLAFNLVLVVCMGPPEFQRSVLLLASPSTQQQQQQQQQPVAHLFLRVAGRGPAVLFTLAGFAVLNLVAVPGLQSGSRSVFALARDDLLPLSRTWRRLSRRSATPVAAVWAYTALVVAVNLLGLLSATAIAAVFNVCAVALNTSYLLPIVCKLLYGRFERGPWHLGRWGAVVNWTAVVWNVLIAVVFFLPTRLPVTGQNMNYAVVVFVFVILVATISWYTHGRHYYTGPGTQPRQASSNAVVAAV